MTPCRRIQNSAAAGRALDAGDRRHLEHCARCAAVLRELRGLDEDLAALHHSAPEDLVASTVRHAARAPERPRAIDALGRRLPFRLGDRALAAGIAAGLALVAVPFLGVRVYELASSRHLVTWDRVSTRSEPARPTTPLDDASPQGALHGERKNEGPGAGLPGADSLQTAGQSLDGTSSAAGADEAGKAKAKREGRSSQELEGSAVSGGRLRTSGDESYRGGEALPSIGTNVETPQSEASPAEEAPLPHRQGAAGADRAQAVFGFYAEKKETPRRLRGQDASESKPQARPTVPASPPAAPVPGTGGRRLPAKETPKGAGSFADREEYGSARDVRAPPEEFDLDVRNDRALDKPATAANEDAAHPIVSPLSSASEGPRETGAKTATDLLDGDDEERAASVPYSRVLTRFGYGVLGYEPEPWRHVTLDRPVYFENTYLGGNAELTLLDHLAGTLDPTARVGPPHRLAHEPPQHLDPPRQGGMALHVDLDRAHVPRGEPSRVFLQVGLVGGENPAWRRPPTSLAALVLAESPEALERARVAAQALRQELGDRDAFAFALPGAPIRFALAGGTAQEPPPAAAPVPLDERALIRTLEELRSAFAEVGGVGNLRSGRLVILTDGALSARVRDEVHRLGLRDVITSVISLQIDRLASQAPVAVAGLGNLHVARTEDEALRAARDEVASLTRTVARALRLNILPAAGVKLIQVLGSRPLSTVETARVKEAEEAVDRRTEETAGIAADRGDDDPGLQTVIPYFYGGDEHVVMVELEVTGPGPVADVSLRYKDLVDMKNQTLRASEAISSRPESATSRQEQVRRNLYAFAVARTLGRLASEIRSGGAAPGGVDDLRVLIAQASADPAGLDDDLRMLRDYARLLAEGSRSGDLASSLEYARLAKLGRSR